MVERIGTCRQCNQLFYYSAKSWAGKGRVTCDKHRDERRREQTANRVRRHRMNQKQSPELPAMTVHIMSCNGKTYCGSTKWGSVAKAVADAIRDGRVRGRICKTCYKLFQADLGGQIK